MEEILLLHTVLAASRLRVLDGAGRERHAALVASGLVDTGTDPNRPRAILLAARASNETRALEVQVSILVDLPTGLLSILRKRLSTGAVSKNTLSHTRAVNPHLLASRLVVEEEVLAEELKDCVVVGRASGARGALLGLLQGETALGGLDAREVDGAAVAEDEELERVGRLLGSGRDDAGGEEGSEEEGLDLHGEGGLF